MTIHLPSLFLGLVIPYVIPVLLISMIVMIGRRRAKKERDRELDRLLAEVAIACIERPSDVREN